MIFILRENTFSLFTCDKWEWVANWVIFWEYLKLFFGYFPAIFFFCEASCISHHLLNNIHLLHYLMKYLIKRIQNSVANKTSYWNRIIRRTFFYFSSVNFFPEIIVSFPYVFFFILFLLCFFRAEDAFFGYRWNIRVILHFCFFSLHRPQSRFFFHWDFSLCCFFF
jgi:hypothetical protein